MTNTLSHHGIKGMHWGIRRYQNKDGTLTPAGQKRYDRDVRENLAKKKENRIDTSNPDPNRWVKEDLTRTGQTLSETSKLVGEFKKMEKSYSPPKQRMDLSHMSDKDLRDKINRELLERQYNDVFNPSKVSSGQKFVRGLLDNTDVALGIASSSVAIALAIKNLKG